jgi:hypothetical protein
MNRWKVPSLNLRSFEKNTEIKNVDCDIKFIDIGSIVFTILFFKRENPLMILVYLLEIVEKD